MHSLLTVPNPAGFEHDGQFGLTASDRKRAPRVVTELGQSHPSGPDIGVVVGEPVLGVSCGGSGAVEDRRTRQVRDPFVMAHLRVECLGVITSASINHRVEEWCPGRRR